MRRNRSELFFELYDHRQIRIWEEHWDERKHRTEADKEEDSEGTLTKAELEAN